VSDAAGVKSSFDSVNPNLMLTDALCSTDKNRTSQEWWWATLGDYIIWGDVFRIISSLLAWWIQDLLLEFENGVHSIPTRREYMARRLAKRKGKPQASRSSQTLPL